MRILLIVTAVTEAGAGMALLVVPSAVVELLLGAPLDTSAAWTLGRVAGAALLAIGVACWLARSVRYGPGQRGLLIGVLIYDTAAAMLLAYGALGLSLAGVALWPAVALHGVLALWCAVCLLIGKSRT